MSIEIPLIHEIKKRPCLYDFNLPEYNRKETLEATWAEVAAACNLTVIECKDKWKNIRSSFVRNLRTPGWKKPYYLSSFLKFIVPFLKPMGVIEVTPDTDDQQQSESEADFGGYTNDDDLEPMATIKIESMDDFESDDINFDDANFINDDDVDDAVANKSNNSTSKKRRHGIVKNTEKVKKKRNSNVTNASTDNNNSMRYFLLSLLPDFESMTEEQIRMFKMRTLILIDDIKADFDQLKNQSSSSVQSSNESERLQKRLINLLLKNLKREK